MSPRRRIRFHQGRSVGAASGENRRRGGEEGIDVEASTVVSLVFAICLRYFEIKLMLAAAVVTHTHPYTHTHTPKRAEATDGAR